MQKAAADVVRSILFSAVIEAIEGLRAASKGLPNTMIRDLQSIHRNTAFDDLPREVQEAIGQSVRAAFNELTREGYALGPRTAIQQSRPMDRVPERERRGPGSDRRGPPRGPRRGGPSGNGPGKGPGGGRPPRKP